LNLYIKEQGLENPENKQIIVPDEKLWKILGDEAREEKITHFTIQKYLNKHFVK
jgi:chromatin remodeling complex protein RSC6